MYNAFEIFFSDLTQLQFTYRSLMHNYRKIANTGRIWIKAALELYPNHLKKNLIRVVEAALFYKKVGILINTTRGNKSIETALEL